MWFAQKNAIVKTILTLRKICFQLLSFKDQKQQPHGAFILAQEWPAGGKKWLSS